MRVSGDYLAIGTLAFGAVSYTHRDVYKRQAQYLLGAGIKKVATVHDKKTYGQGLVEACLLYTSRCV